MFGIGEPRDGSGLNAKLLKIGIPADGPSDSLYGHYSPQIDFREQGQVSPLWWRVPAPEDAWVYSVRSLAFNDQRSAEFRAPNDDPSAGCRGQAILPPPGFLIHDIPDGGCSSPTLRIGYVPEDGLAATGAIEDYTNQPYDTQTAAPPDPGFSTVRERIENQLETESSW